MTLSYAGFYPFRCQACGRRFTHFDWEAADLDFRDLRGWRRRVQLHNLVIACIVIIALTILIEMR